MVTPGAVTARSFAVRLGLTVLRRGRAGGLITVLVHRANRCDSAYLAALRLPGWFAAAIAPVTTSLVFPQPDIEVKQCGDDHQANEGEIAPSGRGGEIWQYRCSGRCVCRH
ncbi:hypothetical protein [Photobacterium alginatilyticum]|uniref:hypothetical protein n=1 Tax=Photobacterium alginatilyticum TaxID=1775171 RepID=UPI001F03CF57|nr:hypothetical protein [Photobacterium alginatilyticum]